MTGESIRFIHASDFHLERPLGDLDEVPHHLKEAMAGAGWSAAVQVFETAILENVDFVLLCGDLFHPVTAGPRGMAMLLRQFEQLQENNVQVFWATGQADDIAKIGDVLALPPNVTVFPKDRAEVAFVRRSGETIAMVVGRSSDGRSALHVPSFRHDPTEEFTVAVGYGSADATSLSDGRFDYWALGGEHQRRNIENAATVGAGFSGTPQGRSLSEPGAHGFQLVDVDADGTSRVHFVEADSFRYVNVELSAAELAGASDLRSIMTQRVSRLQHEHGDRHLLIGWSIKLGAETPLGLTDPAELLQWARREFGNGSPSAWSVKLEIVAPPSFPQAWQDEDTILGDFLRASEDHRKSGGKELDLLPLTEEHAGITPVMESALAEVDPVKRPVTLDHATLLGVELLRGGKPKLAMVGESRDYR